MNDGRDLHGWKRPARPAAVRCSACRRPFAAGHVPAPELDGTLVCRDCRAPASPPPSTAPRPVV